MAITQIRATAIKDGDITDADIAAANKDGSNGTASMRTLGTNSGQAADGSKAILKDGSVAFTADQSMGSHKLTDVTDPVSAQDAATKAYVDSAGLRVKTFATWATTSALPACTYANGSSGVGATLTGNSNGALSSQDNITPVANDYCLIKNQTSGLQNGLYTVTQVGNGGAPFILTRATEMDQTGDFASTLIIVMNGTVNIGTLWYCTNTSAPTIGTTAITFSQLMAVVPIIQGGTGQITAYAANDALNVKGSDLASAATVDLSAATGEYIVITGTTTITAFGTAVAGVTRKIKFAGALTLTHNSTSLILPTGANIATAADDTSIFISEGSGNWRCLVYQRKAGPNLAATATQSDMESPSSSIALVVPSVIKYHPGVAKAWASVDSIASSPLVNLGYNVSSLSDNGVGDITINLSITFSANAYCAPMNAGADDGGFTALLVLSAKTGTSIRVNGIRRSDGTLHDMSYMEVAIFGDL